MKFIELLNTYHKKEGYIYEYWIVEHKGKEKSVVIAQHRRVVAMTNNIPKGYDIHHLNGDKKDNDRKNLLLLPAHIHTKMFHNIQNKIQVIKMKCPNCEYYIPFAEGCACKLYPKKCPYDE